MYPVRGSTSLREASSTFFAFAARRQLFQVEFGVAGDDGEEMLACVGVGEESFEDLFRGETDLARDGDGGEIVGVDLVGAEFVGDAERVEQAGGVGLHSAALGGRASGRSAW